jgi:hypothetical protein
MPARSAFLLPAGAEQACGRRRPRAARDGFLRAVVGDGGARRFEGNIAMRFNCPWNLRRPTGSAFAALALAAAASLAPSLHARQDAAPAAAATVQPAAGAQEDTFPRGFTAGSDQITVYPPNFKSWDGHVLSGTCAMSIAQTGSKSQVFGTIAFTAHTEVNRLNRIVTASAIEITGVSLPTDPGSQDRLERELEAQGKDKVLHIALDRLEAAVPSMSSAPSVPAAPLLNNPPALSIVSSPTVLVPIQGDPTFAGLPGTALQRVLNTPMLLVKDGAGNWWLKIADGWMTAGALAGPWSVGSSNDDLAAAAKWAASQPQINLLAPSPDDTAMQQSSQSQTVSLATLAPTIVVSTAPAEILVTEGAPRWSSIASSGLSFVLNTSANIFRLDATGACFVLVSGRWFTSADLGGPWTYVPASSLPAAFMMIPAESPKENVLASIPGTAQAQEASIANTVPQTARVPLTEALAQPTYAGASVKWTKIGGTIGSGKVEVASNCSTPVFRTDSSTYWAVEKGVWFTGPSFTGPWKVAQWVAPILYTIPPASPYYFVTFVRVYSATPQYVVVGYTPGYFGAYAQDGVVVYGTGYIYSPYCVETWVPVPMTYGYGACMSYNPWAGWAFGFGAGMAVGWAIGDSTWHCGPYPCWGPYWGGYGPHGAYAWGPGGWAATSGNVYHQWGDVSTMSRSSAGYNAWTGNAWSTHTSMSYNSATGARTIGQRGVVENAYTGNWAEGARGAGYNPTTGNYARGGVVAAGNRGDTDVVAGAGTVGNTKTGQSASVAGVKTDNGAWGVARGPDGTAISAGNNVYATHDGSVYKYDGDSDSFQQYNKDGWNDVSDSATSNSLRHQAATRADGDWRSENASRWQPGGGGFDGRASSGSRSWGGGFSGGSSGRLGRAGGFHGGRR